MLLGDVLHSLEDETVALETLVALEDLPLLLRAKEEAARRHVSLGEFTTDAVELFASTASDEDWTTLIGIMGRTQLPGQACLKRMVEFALAPRKPGHACAHGS